MSETREQAQMRRHLAELRGAAAGLGHDFAVEFRNIDSDIERLGHVTAKEAKYLARDIQDELSHVGHELDAGMRAVPGKIADAGIAIGSGAARAGAYTRDAVVEAGRRARTGTKNALAAAAGVRKTPMRVWQPPSEEARSSAGDVEPP